MSNSTLSLVLVAAVAGGIAGAAAAALFGGATPVRTSGADAPALRAAPDPVLVARLDGLATKLDGVSERILALELRPVPEVRSPLGGYVTRDEFAQLAEELRGTRAPLPADDPNSIAPGDVLAEGPLAGVLGRDLKEQVADALTELRKQEKVDDLQVIRAKQQARVESDVVRLSKALALDDVQAELIRGALVANLDRHAALLSAWENGADDAFLAEQKISGQELFEADLAAVLTPAQLATYWSSVAPTNGK